MSKYEKMAKYLGVKMNTPFNVKTPTGYIYGCPYHITENGIYDRSGNRAQLNELGAMFSGTTKIVPCENKRKTMHMGDIFYFIDIDGQIKYGYWTDGCSRLGIFGNVFEDESKAKKYASKIQAMLNN